jgi:hypothetical protein
MSPSEAESPGFRLDHFHVDYEPPDDWIRRILTRLRESRSPHLRRCFDQWGKSPLVEIGLAVATKRAMLRMTVARVDEAIGQMVAEFNADPHQVEWCLSRSGLKGAFRPKDKTLPYRLLVDIDSFLFELRSTHEIVGIFLREFFRRVLQRKIGKADVMGALDGGGVDTRWIDVLRKERVLFFHHTAPWVAFEIDRVRRPKYRLVILKRNARDLSNPNDYVRVDEYRAILRGFEASMAFLRGWVLEQIDRADVRAKA